MQEDEEVTTKEQAVLQQLININYQEHQRAGAGLREANKAGKGRYPEWLLKNLLPTTHNPDGWDELEVWIEGHLRKKNQGLPRKDTHLRHCQLKNLPLLPPLRHGARRRRRRLTPHLPQVFSLFLKKTRPQQFHPRPQGKQLLRKSQHRTLNCPRNHRQNPQRLLRQTRCPKRQNISSPLPRR